LLRHAERGPILDPVEGYTVPLTRKGVADAVALGRDLAGHGPFALRHSPLLRCRQTAEALAAGIESAGGAVAQLESLDQLGGGYVRQPEAKATLARALGEEFVRAWFDGELSQDVVQPLASAARDQLAAMLGALPADSPYSGLFVSHDWNLLIVREHALSLRYEDEGWPGFLDGIALVPQGERILLCHGDRVRRCARSALGLPGCLPP